MTVSDSVFTDIFSRYLADLDTRLHAISIWFPNIEWGNHLEKIYNSSESNYFETN